MKKTKILTHVVLSLLIVIMAVMTFIGCTPKITKTTVDLQVTLTTNIDLTEISVMVNSKTTSESKNYKVQTSAIANFSNTTSIYDVINYLKTEKSLHVVSTDSGYGPFLEEIGEVIPNKESREFISVFTSDPAFKDVSIYCKTRTYNTIEVFTSSMGVNSIIIKSNTTYLFALEKF